MTITFRKFLEDLDTKLQFHDNLNPKLWHNHDLIPEVAQALSKIADEFIEFLDVKREAIKDVILTGSNCNFNYVDGLSDIDLHLVVDTKDPALCPTCDGDFVQDCFWAKKSLWNMEHNISIHGFPVELYAQPVDDNLVAAGVYSLWQKTWLKEPSASKPKVDNVSVLAKAEDLKRQIDDLEDNHTDDLDAIEQVKAKLKQLRSAGLAQGGEFSVENLAFKALRNNGYLDKLSNLEQTIHDKSLSLP